MNTDLLEIGIISDKKAIAAICAELSSDGWLIACHACGDIEAPIASVLVIDEEDEAWALCGTCMRKMPIVGAVV